MGRPTLKVTIPAILQSAQKYAETISSQKMLCLSVLLRIIYWVKSLLTLPTDADPTDCY